MDFSKIDKKKLLILILCFIFIIKIVTAISFNNSDWEPDSFMHFLELRTVFSNFPNNLILGLGVWTKPLYAYTFGLLVQLFNIKDILFVQIFNICISLLISFIVYKIVLKLFGNFKVALLSIIFSSFGLTLFISSTSALTDQLFSLMLVLSAYFALNKKYLLGSLFVGLSVLGRIEGLYFVVIYDLWMLFEQRNLSPKISLQWLTSVIPVFIWNLLGFLNTGLILYIFQAGYPAERGVYGYGSILSYPKQFALGEFIIGSLFILGTIYFLRKKPENRFYYRFLMYIWVLFSGFLIIEAILWKFGMLGSAGLMRYFVGVLPFMIIVSSYGVIWMVSKTNFRNLLLISLFAAQIIFLYLHLGGVIFQKSWVEDNSDFKIAGEWINQNVPTDEFLYADRPETIYYSERNLDSAMLSFEPQWSRGDKGIYVWSKDWGESLYNLYPEDFKNSNVPYKIDERVYLIQID